MKISEFAELNQVTTKMLRHYDNIGLLKPETIDESTGYRSYDKSQSTLLNWIIIFKNLDFSLKEIKQLLSKPTNKETLVTDLIQKRIEITNDLNDQILKKIQLEKLIQIVKREGLQVKKKIEIMNIEESSIHEIKKNIPNMEFYIQNVKRILSRCNKEKVTFMRTDLSHFKEVNDKYGYDVGDKVIVEFFNILERRIKFYQIDAPIARAGGDEFLIFIVGDEHKAHELSGQIIKDMMEFDFKSIGCNQMQGCYIGTLTSRADEIDEPRKLMDDTIEVLYNARDKGVNNIESKTIL